MSPADRLIPRRLSLWTILILATLVVTSPAPSAQGRGGAPAGVQAPGQGGGRGGNAVTTPAGPVHRMPDGKPDLAGVWDGSGGRFTHTAILEDHPGGFGIQAGKTLIIDPPDGIIPYQPAALKERDRRREDGNAYEDLSGHCEKHDVGRIHSFAQEIVHSSNQIIIHALSRASDGAGGFQHITRVIDMEQKDHLPAGIRLYSGDSIGRWEGDTLVVDITNFNGKTRMAIGGDFYSANAHIVERFMPLDSNTIRWTMTIEDPRVFTRPWTFTSAALMTRQREARNFDEEDTCHEGNVDLVHLKNVYEQANGTKWPPETWPPEQ